MVSTGDTRGPIDAFVSYARSSSTMQAASLKEGLETFDRRWDRKRRTYVFLDDQSMSANASLQSAIEGALNRAGWLILLLSEAAAASPWVDREVVWWLTHKGPETLLLVHIDGTVAWAENDFTVDSTAVPPALRGTLSQEPRWIDLQWFAERDDPANDPAFESVVLQLYCPLKGLERAEAVAQRDANVRTAKRLARGAIAGLTLLALGASAAGVAALVQARRANEQAEIARAQTVVAASQTLAARAGSVVNTNYGLAQLLAVQGYELHDNAQTRAAVYDVARAAGNLTHWIEAPADVTAVHFPPEGGVLVGLENGEVLRWNLEEHRLEPLLRLEERVRIVASDDSGQVVVAQADDEAVLWYRGDVVAASSYFGDPAVSRDGQRALIGDQLVDVPTGSSVPNGLYDDIAKSVYELAFSPDGSEMVVLTFDSMERYRVMPGGLDLVSSAPLNHVARNYEAAYFARDGSAFAAFRGVRPWARVWLADGDGNVSGEAPTEGLLPGTIAVSDGGTKLAAFGTNRIVVSEPVPCDEDRMCVRDKDAVSISLTGLGSATVAAFQGDSELVAAAGKSLAIWSLQAAGRGVVQGRSGLPEEGVRPNLAVLKDGSAAGLVDWSTDELVIIQRDPYQVSRVQLGSEVYSAITSADGESFVLVNIDGEPVEWIAADGRAIEPVAPGEADGWSRADNGMWIDEESLTEVRVLDSSGNVVIVAPIPMPMNSHGWIYTVYGLSGDGSQLYVVTGENADDPDKEVQIWPTGAVADTAEGGAMDLRQLVDEACNLVGRALRTDEWDPALVGVPEPPRRACAR